MTKAQKRLRELRERQSQERGRMAELSRDDSLTDETRAELDKIENGTADLERQLRAATLAVEAEEREAKDKGGTGDDKAPDAETRERLELRGRAKIGRYLVAHMRGKTPDGAEAELAAAAGVEDLGIPLELWSVPRAENRQAGESEERVTPAPATVGINLDVLRPAVFAPSIVDKLMVAMPMVGSGTYASGTITTSLTANAVAKGADVPETDGAFTVQTTTPHRVGASLNLSIEDIAAVGQENFESVLREHVSLVLSDELDDQMLNGDPDTTATDLQGFFSRLADPAAPGAAVATFDDFIAQFSGGIDGLWASMMSEVAIVAGVDTYRLSARTFRDPATGTAGGRGDKAFADYAREHTAGWFTNRRMPATAANIQQAILCRKGRSMMPSPMRTAVVPHWGFVSIDDVYTGARKGERRYVLSVLVGDLILVQPNAYAQVSYRVSV